MTFGQLKSSYFEECDGGGYSSNKKGALSGANLMSEIVLQVTSIKFNHFCMPKIMDSIAEMNR